MLQKETHYCCDLNTKTDSVTYFFTVKCGATPGSSTSATIVCDTEDANIDSRSVVTCRNPVTQFILRKEQHKADILWIDMKKMVPSFNEWTQC